MISANAPFSGEWIAVRKRPAASGHPLLIRIPKQVIKTSVHRNRIRRLIREAMRAEGLCPAKGAQWQIKVMRPLPAKTKMQQVRRDLLRSIKK